HELGAGDAAKEISELAAELEGRAVGESAEIGADKAGRDPVSQGRLLSLLRRRRQWSARKHCQSQSAHEPAGHSLKKCKGYTSRALLSRVRDTFRQEPGLAMGRTVQLCRTDEMLALQFSVLIGRADGPAADHS